MSGLYQSLGDIFGVLNWHARSNGRFASVLEGDVGHKINIARSTVKRLDNGVVLFGDEAAAHLAGARDFIVVCIEFLVTVIQRWPHCESGGGERHEWLNLL